MGHRLWLAAGSYDRQAGAPGEVEGDWHVRMEQLQFQGRERKTFLQAFSVTLETARTSGTGAIGLCHARGAATGDWVLLGCSGRVWNLGISSFSKAASFDFARRLEQNHVGLTSNS